MAYFKEFLELHNLFSFLSLPLQVDPLNPAKGLREHCKLPEVVWDRVLAKIKLMDFSLKNSTSGEKIFNYFLECTILHL